MARAPKPTKAQLRNARFNSPFTDDDLNDPRVLAVRQQLAQQEAERDNPPEADFSDVTGTSSTTAGNPGATSLDQLGSAFRGGLADIAGDAIFTATNAPSNIEEGLSGGSPSLSAMDILRGPGTGVWEAIRAGARVPGIRQGLEAIGREATDYANINRQIVDREVQAIKAQSPVRGFAEQAGLDVAGSPQSLASIPGGPFAAIPALTTYNDEYRKGWEAGLTHEQADARATAQAGVEGGISMIPAGKVMGLMRGPLTGAAARVTAPIRSRLTDVAFRTGRVALGESAEESVQYLASQGIDKAISETSSDPVVAKFAERQLSQDLLSDTLRAGAAGFVGGGSLGSLTSSLEVARENGRLASKAIESTDNAAKIRAAEQVAEAKRQADLAPGGEVFMQRMRENLLTPEFRAAAKQRLNNLQARGQAADQELAQLEEQYQTRYRMAEEAGEGPDPFDAQLIERAKANRARITQAQNRVASQLERDAQGQAMQRQLEQQERAATPVAPRNRDLEALSTGTSRRKPATPKLTPEQQAEEIRAQAEADLRNFANGTRAPAAPAASVPSSRALVQNLARNRNTADGKRALSMIANGRIEVVNSLDDLGLDEVRGAKTRGVEKDGKLYIIADNIDKSADIAPQLAATIFHETKHAADFGVGDPELPDNLAGFIGMENSAPINRKIEAAAERGNAIAKLAIQRANKTGVYEEEILPHFITALKESRNKSSGMSNVVTDVVSAVRRGYDRLLGGNNEIQLDDVFKLSEQLTDYVAQNKEFDTTPAGAEYVDGRRMIISKGTGESLALSKGRTYLSADGNRKYEIDDSKSRLTLPDQFEPGRQYTAKDILQHEELYRELPELADVPIQFVSEPDSRYGASYDAETNTVTVNSALIGPNANKFNSNIHQYVVHELQHAAQKASGTTGGANPEMFLSTRGKQLRRQKADLQAAINFGRAMGENTNNSSDELAQVEADYETELEDATNKYKRVLGEQEAYSTAGRIPLTDNERQETTSRLGRTLEQEFIDRDGGVFSERGKRLDTPEFRRETMTPEQRERVRNSLDKLRSTLAGFASAYGKLGKEAGQIAEAATGETSYYSDLGFTTGRLIEQGLNDLASRMVKEGTYSNQKQALEAANAMIRGRVDNLNKIDSEDRRQAAIAGLVREHPELAPLQDAYNIINDNTRIIIRNMLAAKTGPLTNGEIEQMKVLRNNTTRYLTRVYGLFQGKDGNKWANRVAREYAVAKGELSRGNAVPDKIKENYEIYKNALDYVTRNDIAVFDPERLAKLKKEKLDMIYDTWFDNRKGFEDEIKRTSSLPAAERATEVREALIARIIEKGGQVNAQQVENRANTVVRGLLGLDNANNPVAKYYRGFKQDKGILMERTHIPEPIRALFDEITDPALRVMMTISKQGELIARTKMLNELKENLYGDKIISNGDKSDDSTNRFSEQLRGDSWGPLEGYWVTPEVYTIIDDAREIAANMEGALGRVVLDSNAINNSLATRSLRAYTRLAGYQKLAAIVWNPAQTMWNLGGSWLSLLKEGNVNPLVMLRATKAAGRLLAKELRNAGLGVRVVENDPDVSDLIRYDVIDSAMIQEVRQMPFEYSKAAVNAKTPILGNLGKTLKVTKAGVTQVFALSDLTAKIANYFKQVDVLTKYYKAEGKDISEDAIKREAADIIKDTNITFRRTAPIFKMSERLGLTYVMPYIQGVFRSSIYGYVHGTRDILRGLNEAQTAEGRNIMFKQGMGRIAGSSMALFAIQALAKSVLTGDEEKDAKIRQLQFPDARYGDSVYVGDDAKGNPMMLRLSRFDPYGPLTDILRIISSDATTEQKNRDVMQHLHELLIKPRLGQQLLASAYEFSSEKKTVDSKQTKLERIFPQSTEATKDFIANVPRFDYSDGEQLISLLDTMVPGASNIIDPTNVTPVSQRKGYPTPDATDETVADVLTAMGGRLDKIDPKAAAVTAGLELQDARKEARERVYNRLSTVNPNDRQAVVAIMDVMDKERKAFIRLKEVYEGMEALGMSRREIDKILKDNAKVNEHDRHLLYSGKYDTSLENWKTSGSSILSRKSIQQRNKLDTDRAPDPVKAEQRTESIKKAVKVLRDAGYKVKE